MMIDKKRWSWQLITRVDAVCNRIYGSRYNPLYQSGSITVLLFAVLLVTGLYLLLFYRLGAPYSSVARMTEQAWSGRWIRGVHRFASDAAVIAVIVHAFRMYAQRKDWGPRALAWVSGLILFFVLLVCGWTGYVMVWDTQAQLLAVEGARFLDALPIFSEPISRTFVGERPLPNAFFFLNLFAHIALPIGLGLLIWVHVSRTARPKLMPPRKLSYALMSGLLALAVIWPIGMAPQADLLRMPENVPLDVFFGFWLPATKDAPAWAVWLVGSAAGLVLVMIPVLSRPPKAKQPAKSVVNERHCTGCEQCMHDCPYGAIAMIPRPDGREGIVARVNPDLCVACGICTGSCAPMALGPANQTGRDQLTAMKSWHAEQPSGPRDIVLVGCAWSAAPGMMERAGVRYFEIGCAGNLHTSTVEFLVRSGAGGVLIAACPQRDCRGREGTKWLYERLYEGREAELKERVDRRRIRVVEAGAGEPGVLGRALEEFQADVARLAIAEGEENVDLKALCEREGVA